MIAPEPAFTCARMHSLARFSATKLACVQMPEVLVPTRRRHVYKGQLYPPCWWASISFIIPQFFPPTSITPVTATMTDHTKCQGPAGAAQAANSLLIGDGHLLTSSLGEEGDGGTYPTDTLTRNLLESDCATEAQAHWLDNSLAFSAFFTVSQYPNALWQTSSFPVLSTVELVDRVLDKKGLRRIIALQVGANIVTHCVPVVAKILHDLGHQCLCQSSVENVGSKVQDWLRQQVDAAVPELLWHAGRTPFARANYLMVLVEEIFRTLPISWTDAIAQAEDGDVLSHALQCINQAVRCAEVEPQAVLGVWAAKHMIPDAHVSTKEQADPVSQTPVQEDYQSVDSIMLSPPDSECTTCLGSSCL